MSNHIELLENEISRKKTMLTHLYTYEEKSHDIGDWMNSNEVIVESEHESSSLGLISKIVEEL